MKLLIRLILMNTRPIALVVLGAVIGMLFGNALAGALCALGFLAVIHLFL